MQVFFALISLYGLLLIVGGMFFIGAKPVAVATAALGGLPALLFVLAKYLIPAFSFVGGLFAWRSFAIALLLGLPLLPLSALVFITGSAGPEYMGVPIPWPSAVALGTAGSTSEMLRTQALPYSVAFLAGLLFGALARILFKPGERRAA